jgi:hypothetical protein
VPKLYKLYTVYDNKTDFPIIVDGTAKECCKVMNMTIDSFYSAVTLSRSHVIRRWTILARSAHKAKIS